MSKDPAFPFYAQDFLTGVMHLDFDLRGRYITLLAYQWNNEDKIPKKRLGFLIGVTWEELDEDLKEKFSDCGEYIANTRLLEERDKRKRFKERQSANGKKGGRPPKNTTNNSSILKPKQNPTQTQKKPLEDEEGYINNLEVKIEYSETDFLKDWKTVREKVDGKPTNIAKLTFIERQNFTQLSQEFSATDFKQAIQGLFMQQGMMDSTRLRPTHFLNERRIEIYLDAFKNKIQLYKKKTGTRL